MSNFPIRFGAGQGLERSSAAQTQAGLLELRNVDLAERNAVAARAGYPPVSMAADVGVTAQEVRALWFRGDDLAAEVVASTASNPTPRLWQYTPTLTNKWRQMGPWSRYTLRDVGAAAYQSGEVVNASASQHVVNGEQVTWTVLERRGGTLTNGSFLLRESGGIEAEETLITAASAEPIICYVTDDSALIAYKNGTNIRYREVTPALGTDSNTLLNVSGGNAWYATAGTFPDGTKLYVFAVLTSGNQLVMRFVVPGGASWTTTRALAVSTGTHNDIDLKLVFQTLVPSNTVCFLYVGTASGANTETFRFSVDINAATATLSGQTNTNHGGSTAFAVAVDPSSTGSFHMAVELSVGGIGISYVEYRIYTAGAGSSLIFTRNFTALMSGFAGTTVDTGSGGQQMLWLSIISNANSVARRGAVLLRPNTGEIVARAGVGLTERTDRRFQRKKHGPLNRADDGTLSFAAAYYLVALDPLPKEAAVWTLREAYRNRPAVLDSIAVSAHGGYPRAYDGQTVFEQDWHELPEYTAAVSGAVSFAAGTYGLAVTDEWTDRTGQVYRSAPTFATIVLNGAQTAQLTLQPIQYTERTGVRRVLWRTLANGTVYYRAGEFDAHTATTATYTDIDSVISVREALDQVADGVSPSQQARVTDFVAAVGARLWSRDPRRGRLARFSQPRREGFAPGWPLTFGVELEDDRDITAIDGLDGRVVLFGREQIAYTQGAGPDPTGAGSYPVPGALAVEIGAEEQATLAIAPYGLYFGCSAGVRLLSRGLEVVDVSEAIDALYEVDEQGITGLVYRNAGAELIVTTASGEQLVYHDKSARWATWGPDVGLHSIVAMAQSQGMVAWADSAAVVHIRDAATYTDDGVTAVPIKIATPPLKPYLQRAAHTAWNLQQITLYGTYRGVHELQLSIFCDDEATAREDLVVSAITLADNAAAGRPYIYRAEIGGIECYTARIEVSAFHIAPGESFLLEGIDIEHSSTSAAGAQLGPEHLFQNQP